MSKRVLLISSSPRKDGNSDTLCNEFMRGAIDTGNHAEKIFLRDKQINYCIGCGYCMQNDYSGCSQKDDMTEITDKITESDVIVLATPVYFYTLSGQMKTFIDRCCSKYTHFRNKEFYFIVTATDTDASMLERTIDCFQGFLDLLENPQIKGTIYGAGLWHRKDVLNSEYMEIAYNMGRNV